MGLGAGRGALGGRGSRTMSWELRSEQRAAKDAGSGVRRPY